MGSHFWAIGNGAWSTENITDKMVNEYQVHHRKDGNDNSKLYWNENFSRTFKPVYFQCIVFQLIC